MGPGMSNIVLHARYSTFDDAMCDAGTLWSTFEDTWRTSSGRSRDTCCTCMTRQRVCMCGGGGSRHPRMDG